MNSNDHALLYILEYLRQKNSPVTKICHGISSRATGDMLVGRQHSTDIGLLTVMAECFEAGRSYEKQQWNKLINGQINQQQAIQPAAKEVGGLDGIAKVE